MPPFSPQHPRRFVSLLLGDRRWLSGFGTETAGWLVYVAALRIAPLSLVQAVCASGIAVLALASAHGHPGWLARRQQVAVLIAITGLLLLALSLVGTHQADHPPGSTPILLWLSGLAAAALVLARFGAGLARGASLGLAAGLLFAGGDISAKLVVYGGVWLVAASSLIVCYALGTSVLQGAFQHGDALTGAGLATLATNAVPIAAGFFVFGEQLPGGARGVLQLVAFASLVGSAVLLARVPRPVPPRPSGDPCHFHLAPGARLGRFLMNPNATHTGQTIRTAIAGSISSRTLVGVGGTEAGLAVCRQVAQVCPC